MQRLEGSATPVLYVEDARFLKVKYLQHFVHPGRETLLNLRTYHHYGLLC